MKLPTSRTAALPVATHIMTALAPACKRIALAGSLARESPVVGDIEIVCIPRIPTNLFGDPDPQQATMLDHTLADLIISGQLAAPTLNGPKQKQFMLLPSGLTLDLFITSPQQWGVIYTLRVGPATFSRKIVTSRQYGGLLDPACVVREGRVYRLGEVQATPEPEDFFRFLGGWVPPQHRT